VGGLPCGTETRPFISGDRRELYANIEEPETAQTILRHPKSPHLKLFSRQLHPLIPGHLANSVGSPEKAGVGGSIPSLATVFSKTCRHSVPGFGSNWFQFQPADKCLVRRSVRRSITGCSSLIPPGSSAKAIEIEDIEARVSELERAAEASRQGR
jgi:hypothetical protein